MKKILTILMTILMAFALVACQKDDAIKNEQVIEKQNDEPVVLCDDKYCLVGSYSDSVSQRAYMDITVNPDETYNIIVHWADGASNEKEWVISNAKYNPEKQTIDYAGEYISLVSYDETGTELSRETTAANNLGYFSVQDKILYWTGAAMEECRSCIFMQIAYI